MDRSTSIDIDNGGPVVVLTQAFDAAGNRTSLAAEIDTTDDFLNTFTYDNLNRLTRITQAGQGGGNTVAEKRVDFAYNAAGQFTAIDWYKDTDGGSTHLVVETAYTYDLIGRLTDLVHTYDTTDIADYHWDYDAFGRITEFTFAFSDAEDGSSTFSYDATGQLTAADHTAQADESFSYDENGNRTMGGYDTGGNNLLLSDGVFDSVYDLEGNRISRTRISNDPADDKTVEYTWDHRNRLTRVLFKDNSNDLTKEVIYEYDAFDRRITKIIDADGEGVGSAEQTDFIYDGQNIVLALDGEGDVTNRYLYGPAIDMVLADEQVYNELLWTLTDNQGSVRDLVDNAGTVESHIDYSSFGKVDLITDDLVQTLYGFTGRERDAETDLNYHRARYYDPVIGRWLSEDPISFAGGDTNLYRYVFNNSVLYTDPTGLFAQDLEGLINQFTALGKKLMNGAANMPEEVKSALLDLTQLGLDVGGIFEPTPFCDITSGIMSGFRGDWWGAGTSVIGFLPGIGDLAKIARIGKYTDMLTNMVKVVGKHADIGATVMPILENLHKVIGNGMEMLGKLSEGAANAFGNFQNLLQQAIDKVGLGAKKVAGNGGCFIAGTDVVMAALPIPAEIREKYSLAPLWLPAAYTNAATVGVAAAGVAGYAASKRKRKRKPGKAQAGRKCAAGFRLDGWWR